MKNFIALLFLVFIGNKVEAQFFKKLKDKVKEEVDWRVQRKAGQKIDQGLDSVLNVPNKILSKKSDKTPKSDQKNQKGQEDIQKDDANGTQSQDESMDTKNGHVTLTLSVNKVFAGGSISISGESVMAKKFTQVEITVKGPATNDVKSILLATDGKYNTIWNASDKTGEFTVTVKSSDKKAQQSAHFTVYALSGLGNLCDENIEVTNKAYDKLESAVEQVKGSIGTKDKVDIDKKLAEVKQKVDQVNKLFKDLNKAGSEIGQLAKSGKNLSPKLAGNLSELNNSLADQAKKMRQMEEYANHKPLDNTVCEYLVMVNEACAAFSTLTNVWTLSIATLINNIALDKGTPKVTGMINERYKGLSEPNDFALKEPAKIFATSKLDAESLVTKLGTASFAGDMVQFATDFLLKRYCGVYKGNFTHDYHIDYRNAKRQNWWSYGFNVKATVSLRYPKEKMKGNIIKMKGNLEGNATKFTFFEDIEKEDGFQEGTKGKIQVIPIKTFIPLSVSFATSERDVMGFGAIARGLATPAYFNIPIDAEYDVEAGKIKIFVNNALRDFSNLVANQFLFLLVGGDLLPYVKKMNFPISKAKSTISSVLYKNNEFIVAKDAKGNLSFKGKANKHIGGPTDNMEHDLNFSISASKE